MTAFESTPRSANESDSRDRLNLKESAEGCVCCQGVSLDSLRHKLGISTTTSGIFWSAAWEPALQVLGLRERVNENVE